MALSRISTQDRNLQLIQDNVEAALIPLQTAPLSGGVLLSGITLSAGVDNLIQHTLGRVPKIVIASLPNVNSVIWTPVSASLNGTNADSTRVNLWCSVGCTVSVWVN